MLTKYKKQRGDETFIEDSGTSKLDVSFNHFIDKNESQFKLITMPTPSRSGSVEQKPEPIKLDNLMQGPEETVTPEYHTEMFSPLYADDRGMLLKPKKRKEYRYSKAIDVVP
jgi:hypothetical protein